MLGFSRVAFGGAFMVLPGLLGRVWAGSDARRPGVKAITRALGIRDLLLGVGALRAVSADEPTRQWLTFGAISDGVDATATLLAYRHVPRSTRRGLVAGAGAAAGLGVWLASRTT